MAEFGENVRRLREERGLTQQSLADRLYVTRQAVSRWEGGSRYVGPAVRDGVGAVRQAQKGVDKRVTGA